jgi:hypothetical protein
MTLAQSKPKGGKKQNGCEMNKPKKCQKSHMKALKML